MPTTVSPLSIPPSSPPPLSPRFTSPLFPFQKSLQKMTTKQDQTRYNKIRHMPSYRGWARPPSGVKKSEIDPLPLLGVPQKQANSLNTDTEDLAKIRADPMLAISVSVSACESCWVGSECHAQMSSIPLTSTVFPPSLPRASPVSWEERPDGDLQLCLHNVWLWILKK